MKTFPIQSNILKNQAVPFEVALKCEKRLKRNHNNQSVEVLASRGGLTWAELVCGLLDLPLFGAAAEQYHQDEKLAYSEYRKWMAKNSTREKLADPVQALRAVLSLYPVDMRTDGYGIGFRPEVKQIIEDARACLEKFEQQPMHRVWLNLEDGKFGNSVPNTGSAFNDANRMCRDVDEIAMPLWKLIEFRCLNDSDFVFTDDMRLR